MREDAMTSVVQAWHAGRAGLEPLVRPEIFGGRLQLALFDKGIHAPCRSNQVVSGIVFPSRIKLYFPAAVFRQERGDYRDYLRLRGGRDARRRSQGRGGNAEEGHELRFPRAEIH